MAKKNLFAHIYAVNRNKTFGRVMELSAIILGNGYVQALVEIIYVFFSSIYFSKYTVIKFWFVIVTAIYALLTLIFIYLDNRKTRIINASDNLIRVSRELEKLIGDRMRKLTNKSRIFSPYSDFDTEVDREAFLICNALYRTLSIYLNYSEIEVVLWKLFDNECKDKPFMIIPLAFATETDNPPYWINNNFSEDKIKEYQIYQCIINNSIIKLISKHECQATLWYPDYKSKQESDTFITTCQYLAIPIRKRNGKTFAAIQIRTFQEKILPTDSEELNAIINDCIYPFTTYYELVEEEQITIDCFLDFIDKLYDKLEGDENEENSECQSSAGDNRETSGTESQKPAITSENQ